LPPAGQNFSKNAFHSGVCGAQVFVLLLFRL
jgi:hypothetical protein